MTVTPPGAADAAWPRDLRIVLATLFFLFVNVTLLVPVLPVVAGDAAGSTGAGAATAAFFFAAVAAQLAAPLVLHRFSANRVLAVSLAAMALPCLAYVWRPESLTLVLAATAARGLAFGLAVVACGTFLASRAPSGRLGAAVGYAGLAAGVPPVFAPTGGLWLLERSGPEAAFAVGGAVGVAAALAVLGLSRLPTRDAPRPRLLRSLAEPLLRRPLIWFGLTSAARGAVISFVPLTLGTTGIASAGAFLFLFGTLAYLSRWASGRLADRVGAARMIVPAALVSIAGLVVLASGSGAAAVATSAILFGLGNGTLMTASQLVMLAQARDGHFAVPTAAWNVALDCGFGLGGLALGVVAAFTGYGVAFWLLPAVMAGVLVLAVQDDARARERFA